MPEVKSEYLADERHEKALEAAVVAFLPERLLPETMHDAISRAISAYLQAMDAVIVPKKPDVGMMFAGGNMRIYPSVYMGGPPEQAKREAARIFETMISVAPNHFTNGE